MSRVNYVYFKKLSDNQTILLDSLKEQVISFAATIPGTYYLFGLHYADGSKKI